MKTQNIQTGLGRGAVISAAGESQKRKYEEKARREEGAKQYFKGLMAEWTKRQAEIEKEEIETRRIIQKLAQVYGRERAENPVFRKYVGLEGEILGSRADLANAWERTSQGEAVKDEIIVLRRKPKGFEINPTLYQIPINCIEQSVKYKDYTCVSEKIGYIFERVPGGFEAGLEEFSRWPIILTSPIWLPFSLIYIAHMNRKDSGKARSGYFYWGRKRKLNNREIADIKEILTQNKVLGEN